MAQAGSQAGSVKGSWATHPTGVTEMGQQKMRDLSLPFFFFPPIKTQSWLFDLNDKALGSWDGTRDSAQNFRDSGNPSAFKTLPETQLVVALLLNAQTQETGWLLKT